MQSSKKRWVIWVGVCLSLAFSFLAMLSQQRRGLNGAYYPNMNWEWPPLISRIDRSPYLRGDTGQKLLGKPTYSVKWTGWIALPRSGTYRFATQSDDGSALWVNGQEVVNNGGAQRRAGNITIKRGVYPIEIYYFQIGGNSLMKVSWKPPRSVEQPIPDMVLFITPPAWIERITNKLIWEVSEVLRTRQGIFLSSIVLLIVLDVLRWRGIAPSMGIKKIPGTYLMFLAILVSALPILYIISFGFTLHQVPNNDYWGSFNGIFSSGGMRGLFTKSNEHTVVIPHLFYYVNYLLTKGNNRGLFIWNVLIVGGTLGFAINLLKQCSFLQKQEIYLAMPMCAIFLFAPSPADSWLLSMGGVMWFSANFFFFAALYFFMRALRNSSLAMLIWSGCCALCGAFSYSSGIFAFLAIMAFLLLYVVFFKTGWTGLIIYVIVFGVYCGWWLGQTPVHLAGRKLQLVQTWTFGLTYLGNLFTTSPEQAAEFGVAGMFGFVLVGLMALYSGLRKDRVVFLRLGSGLICMFYAIINILATSRMRNDALELRYASISLIFWLGGATAVFMLIRSLDVIFPKRMPITYLKKRLSLVFWIALLLFVISPMYHESIPKFKYIHQGFQDQRLAILSLHLELYDTEMLYTKISIAPSQVIAIVPLLKKTHHVPFDRLLIPEYEYDKALEPDRISQEGCPGQFATAIELEHDIFQVQGENHCPQIKYILIANDAQHLRGGAIIMQQNHAQQTASDGSVSRNVRWQGYAKLQSQERALIAYAVLPDDRLLPLGRYEK